MYVSFVVSDEAFAEDHGVGAKDRKDRDRELSTDCRRATMVPSTGRLPANNEFNIGRSY